MSDIKQHLSELIRKRASARDAELDKRAGISEDLDGADDGTQAATTGERAAENKAESAKHTAAASDGGAKSNELNASVSKNTEGSSAGDANKGSTGAVMAPVKDADNGAEKPENKVAHLLAEAKSVAQALRKVASELSDDKPAPAQTKKAAASGLDKMGQYLVAAARNSGNDRLNKVAAEMDDAALADAAGDEMLAGLESGEIDETTAEQILQEAAEYGAVTDDDVGEADEAALEEVAMAAESGELSEEEAAAVLDELASAGMIEDQDLEGADELVAEELAAAAESGQLSEEEAEAALAELLDAGAIDEGELEAAAAELGEVEDQPVGDPTIDDIAAAEELAGPEVADAVAGTGSDEEASDEEKLAFLLEVGPGHPDYLKKLAYIYPDAVEAGADDFDKLAQDLLSKKAEPDDPPAPEAANKNEAQPKTNAGAADKGGKGGTAAGTDLSSSIKVEGPTSDIEKAALAKAASDLGLSEEEAQHLLNVKVAMSDEEALTHKFRSALLAKAAGVKAQSKK